MWTRGFLSLLFSACRKRIDVFASLSRWNYPRSREVMNLRMACFVLLPKGHWCGTSCTVLRGHYRQEDRLI